MMGANESTWPPKSPRQLLGKSFQVNVQGREEKEQAETGSEGERKNISSWSKNKPFPYCEKLQYIMLRGVYL